MNYKKFFVGISAAGILASATLAADKKAASASDASPSPAASAAGKGTRPFPFHGMVAAVDHNAKTFTITGKEKSRVFKVTDKTQVMKGANSATVKDIAENQEVSGSYWKNADGSLEAKIVKLGPMGAAKADKTAKTSASPAASASASPRKP